MSREFGIYPTTHEPKLYWGARAIITQGYVDIPWDRKSFDGDKESPDCDDFFDWINSVALPKLNDAAEKRVWGGEIKLSLDSEHGCFHCEADTKESGGYLYIGCWTTEKMDKGGIDIEN